MPEDYEKEYPEIDEDAECEAHLEGVEVEGVEVEGVEVEGVETEYEEEEITSEEVDRVLESLTNLLETVESATVHEYLEETYNQIFSLIYEEEEATAEEATAEEEMVALEKDEVDFEDDLEDDSDDNLRNEEAA